MKSFQTQKTAENVFYRAPLITIKPVKILPCTQDTTVLGGSWLQNEGSGDMWHLAKWHLLSASVGMACNFCIEH